MNINFTIECETCGERTNIRFGLSNREVQPVRFACQSCGSPIDITIGRRLGEIEGAKEVAGAQPFDAETSFVDLHIDFPVLFGPYEMGMTPFMRAAGRVGFEEMQIHVARLNHLNDEMAKARFFQTLLKLYAKERWVPFRLNIERTFGIKVQSDRPEDTNAALYLLIAHMMAAYEFPGDNRQAADDHFKAVMRIAEAHKAELDDFISRITDNKFLKNLQLDVLEIYPKMLDAELVIRPALFLDFDEEYAANPIPMRVSAQKFETFKDLYKDIAEIIGREIILVAALNNLEKRGSPDAFAPVINKKGDDRAPKTLDDFANLPLGSKLEFLDEPWVDLAEGVLDNRLRNAIAHYKTEYDDITQVITYFPSREGMGQEKGETMYFLEFVRGLLLIYREMHRLHHLIKALFYYRYLILKDAP